VTAHRLTAAFVGARSRGTLSLFPALGAKSFQSKSFRLPAAAESLSLCVLKEKVTKEKEHPASALSGHPARKVRVRATGFVDRASCPDAKLACIHASHPSGFSSTRPPLQRGPRVEQRASCAHFSEKPGQEQSNSKALPRCCFGLSVFHRVRARMARCSTRGPCAAVSRGRQAAERASAWMPMPFRQHMDVLSKSPASTHGLAGQEPGKRQAGWPSLLVTFLLATQEKSDSVAAGDRPLFALSASNVSRIAFATSAASRAVGAAS